METPDYFSSLQRQLTARVGDAGVNIVDLGNAADVSLEEESAANVPSVQIYDSWHIPCQLPRRIYEAAASDMPHPACGVSVSEQKGKQIRPFRGFSPILT